MPHALVRHRSIRLFPGLLALLLLVLAPSLAAAQGPAGGSTGAKASVGTGGSSASGGSKGKSGRFEFPEVVFGGNSLSFVAPLQVGLVSYVPKARLGVQYERQLYKGQWVHAGVSALFDNGDWKVFKAGGCGLGTGVTGRCGRGTVAGFDVYGGYTYKFYLKDKPWLVPHVRGTAGFSYWWYPDIGGSRQQSRFQSWAITLRPGGGVRVFLLRNLGVGMDLSFDLGPVVHREQPLGGERGSTADFLLAMEILPLIVEWRF